MILGTESLGTAQETRDRGTILRMKAHSIAKFGGRHTGAIVCSGHVTWGSRGMVRAPFRMGMVMHKPGTTERASQGKRKSQLPNKRL